MNKEINEFDRMTIGVREWAIERVLCEESLWEDAATFPKIREDVGIILEAAGKLEEFVLGDIKEEPRGFLPDTKY